MTKELLKQIEEEFKKELVDKFFQIDPEDLLDWYSLTIGWAIGKGYKPSDAIDIAVHIRYETELG